MPAPEENAAGPDPVLFATHSGRRVDLLAPRPEDVEFEDVARALSMTCRFGGHVSKFYSVAEHSILVSHMVPRRLALAGLLHDAHEAYLGDAVTPWKRALGPLWGECARRWDLAISKRFGVDLVPEHEDVREADLAALWFERRQLASHPEQVRLVAEQVPEEVRDLALPLASGRRLLCMPPELAEREFTARCLDLCRR